MGGNDNAQGGNDDDQGGASSGAGTCGACGIERKTGRPSCCARGGDWFKQCGKANAGKPHTWDDGIQACGASAAMRGQVGNMLRVSRQTNRTGSDSAYNLRAIATDGKLCEELTTIVTFV